MTHLNLTPAPDAASCDNPALPVAGVIPFSATDWPGHLTVTAFTQGCPWRCVYCHNPALQEIKKKAEHSFSDVVTLLEERRGLLDGLVISGGEPTVHRELPKAIAFVHSMGFPVGLHSCGYAPKRLASLLENPATRPDWIGLDLKALPIHLPQVVGCTAAAARLSWKSLSLVACCARKTGMGVEIRTTSWPGSVVEEHLNRLREEVAAHGYELVVHEARNVDKNGIYQLL